MLPQGSNGQPVESYTVTLTSPVSEVQTVAFGDTAGVFDGSWVRLSYLNVSTRCISLAASALELEVKLQEVPGLSLVKVAMDPTLSTATLRVFHVTFDAVSGNVPTLVYLGPCQAYNGPLAAMNALGTTKGVVVSSMVNGQAAFTPTVVSFATTGTSVTQPAIGSLEVRYDFVGNFQKAAPSADQTATLTANITAGQRTAHTSASVNHLLAPGAVMRVGDQEVTVEKVTTDGRTVTFTPYSVHGAVNLDLYVMETLVGAATPTSVTTFTMSTDATMEIFPGDMVRLTRSNNNGPDIVSSKVTTYH